MSQKLATIEILHSITPHFNPEVNRIECAKIKEWPVVIPKGQFKEGDKVVFITIDSIVPKDNPVFAFMERQKYRVRNSRFKGASSSGLVQSLSILPAGEYNVGDDVTATLRIEKFELPENTNVNGECKGGFPSHLISISDELNLLSYPEALKELEGKEIRISQKADGSSSSFIVKDNEFFACSRRLSLKEGQGFPWEMVAKYNIQEKLRGLGYNIAIQAETIGEKMNGNAMGLKGREIRVFRAKNLDTHQIFTADALIKLCQKLELPIVLEIERFVFNPAIHTVEYFRNLANSQKYPNGANGEGIVISPVVPFYSLVLDKAWSVKVINQDY